MEAPEATSSGGHATGQSLPGSKSQAQPQHSNHSSSRHSSQAHSHSTGTTHNHHHADLNQQFKRLVEQPLTKFAKRLSQSAIPTLAQIQLEELSMALDDVIKAADAMLEAEKTRATVKNRESRGADDSSNKRASGWGWGLGWVGNMINGDGEDSSDDDDQELTSAMQELKRRAKKMQEEASGMGMWLNEVGFTENLSPVLSELVRNIKDHIAEPLREWNKKREQGARKGSADSMQVSRGPWRFVDLLKDVERRVDGELAGVYQLFWSMDRDTTETLSSTTTSTCSQCHSSMGSEEAYQRFMRQRQQERDGTNPSGLWAQETAGLVKSFPRDGERSGDVSTVEDDDSVGGRNSDTWSGPSDDEGSKGRGRDPFPKWGITAVDALGIDKKRFKERRKGKGSRKGNEKREEREKKDKATKLMTAGLLGLGAGFRVPSPSCTSSENVATETPTAESDVTANGDGRKHYRDSDRERGTHSRRDNTPSTTETLGPAEQTVDTTITMREKETTMFEATDHETTLKEYSVMPLSAERSLSIKEGSIHVPASPVHVSVNISTAMDPATATTRDLSRSPERKHDKGKHADRSYYGVQHPLQLVPETTTKQPIGTSNELDSSTLNSSHFPVDAEKIHRNREKFEQLRGVRYVDAASVRRTLERQRSENLVSKAKKPESQSGVQAQDDLWTHQQRHREVDDDLKKRDGTTRVAGSKTPADLLEIVVEEDPEQNDTGAVEVAKIYHVDHSSGKRSGGSIEEFPVATLEKQITTTVTTEPAARAKRNDDSLPSRTVLPVFDTDSIPVVKVAESVSIHVPASNTHGDDHQRVGERHLSSNTGVQPSSASAAHKPDTSETRGIAHGEQDVHKHYRTNDDNFSVSSLLGIAAAVDALGSVQAVKHAKHSSTTESEPREIKHEHHNAHHATGRKNVRTHYGQEDISVPQPAKSLAQQQVASQSSPSQKPSSSTRGSPVQSFTTPDEGFSVSKILGFGASSSPAETKPYRQTVTQLAPAQSLSDQKNDVPSFTSHDDNFAVSKILGFGATPVSEENQDVKTVPEKAPETLLKNSKPQGTMASSSSPSSRSGTRISSLSRPGKTEKSLSRSIKFEPKAKDTKEESTKTEYKEPREELNEELRNQQTKRNPSNEQPKLQVQAPKSASQDEPDRVVQDGSIKVRQRNEAPLKSQRKTSQSPSTRKTGQSPKQTKTDETSQQLNGEESTKRSSKDVPLKPKSNESPKTTREKSPKSPKLDTPLNTKKQDTSQTSAAPPSVHGASASYLLGIGSDNAPAANSVPKTKDVEGAQLAAAGATERQSTPTTQSRAMPAGSAPADEKLDRKPLTAGEKTASGPRDHPPQGKSLPKAARAASQQRKPSPLKHVESFEAPGSTIAGKTAASSSEPPSSADSNFSVSRLLGISAAPASSSSSPARSTAATTSIPVPITKKSQPSLRTFSSTATSTVRKSSNNSSTSEPAVPNRSTSSGDKTSPQHTTPPMLTQHHSTEDFSVSRLLGISSTESSPLSAKHKSKNQLSSQQQQAGAIPHQPDHIALPALRRSSRRRGDDDDDDCCSQSNFAVRTKPEFIPTSSDTEMDDVTG